MCYEPDSRPPVAAGSESIAGAGHVTLRSADGTAFTGYEARAHSGDGTAMLILPDVRGLVPYYQELAVRFAEHGIDALAIDYFGRTAPPAEGRPAGFEYHDHVDRTTFADLRADVQAGAAHLRSDPNRRVERLFTVGFCFGGRLSFLAATFGLELAGVIGLHAGLGPRNDLPIVADVASDIRAPVLGLFGGADPSIPPEAVAAFDAALDGAGVEHRFVTYPGAPHSFFDRKYEEFAAQCAAAWDDLLAFVRAPHAAPV
jgi:carboxymethylenebutenolidase